MNISAIEMMSLDRRNMNYGLKDQETPATESQEPVTKPQYAMKALEGDEIILAYPTMFSNIPYLVRDFINSPKTTGKGKKIFHKKILLRALFETAMV